MAAPRLTISDLRMELDEYRERYPNLSEDALFVLWFLRALITEDEAAAAQSICGGANDKNVDAVLIDHDARIVFLVQGKYRKELGAITEKRNDVLGFAKIASEIAGDNNSFATLVDGMSPDVERRLTEARERITKRDYGLQLIYVTTGKCSRTLGDEAEKVTRASHATLDILDGQRVLLLLSDYFDGVAPPVPMLDLEIETAKGGQTSGLLNRYDRETDIESWIFSMAGASVATLFNRAGVRLFARNVRGFLGSTEINRGMEATLQNEPQYFWYYNNGITIVCDDARRESARGMDILRVTNPQVINGQQTTRTLARKAQKGSRSSVLVRVIRVPREHEGHDRFERLVSQIVAATNSQNYIRPSDLMSNDRKQIQIERQLRKIGYLYIRKRMTKGEARRAAGYQYLRAVKKEEFAQAVVGCDLDPAIVREGKEILFEESWYGRVFSTSDPRFFLSRYWLMRQVRYMAVGARWRTYARWHVLHFVWEHLDPICRGRVRADYFRDACERKNEVVLEPLRRAIETVYADTQRFYRKNRGVGEAAADPQTYFKRRNLHDEFATFWRRRNNPSRSKFLTAFQKFSAAIQRGSQG